MFFSKSTNGFYSHGINGDNIPSDAVEIAEHVYIDLLESQSQGKIIQPDTNGYPVALDRQPPSVIELEYAIRNERNKRALPAIDTKSKYEREQISISKGISISDPMSESDYILALQYLQDLFDIPQQDGFPWDGPDDQLCPWPTKPDCICDTSIV